MSPTSRTNDGEQTQLLLEVVSDNAFIAKKAKISNLAILAFAKIAKNLPFFLGKSPQLFVSTIMKSEFAIPLLFPALCGDISHNDSPYINSGV